MRVNFFSTYGSLRLLLDLDVAQIKSYLDWWANHGKIDTVHILYTKRCLFHRYCCLSRIMSEAAVTVLTFRKKKQHKQSSPASPILPLSRANEPPRFRLFLRQTLLYYILHFCPRAPSYSCHYSSALWALKVIHPRLFTQGDWILERTWRNEEAGGQVRCCVCVPSLWHSQEEKKVSFAHTTRDTLDTWKTTRSRTQKTHTEEKDVLVPRCVYFPFITRLERRFGIRFFWIVAIEAW